MTLFTSLKMQDIEYMHFKLLYNKPTKVQCCAKVLSTPLFLYILLGKWVQGFIGTCLNIHGNEAYK